MEAYAAVVPQVAVLVTIIQIATNALMSSIWFRLTVVLVESIVRLVKAIQYV